MGNVKDNKRKITPIRNMQVVWPFDFMQIGND